MVAEVLASDDIAAGRNVVEALDKAKFPVEAAFWLYESNLERWTLWIATLRAAEDLGRAYLRVRQILDTVTDRAVLDLPRIRLASPNERTVLAVKSLIDVKGVSDVRMRHNLGDHGVYIEDTLIYRTAA
ncbi:MAG: hypothetical protein WAN86_18045 [Hyphomicrobiaceae bacterium]